MRAIEQHVNRQTFGNCLLILWLNFVGFLRMIITTKYLVERSRIREVEGQLKECIDSDYLKKGRRWYSPRFVKDSANAKRVGFFQGYLIARSLSKAEADESILYGLVALHQATFLERIYGRRD